MLKNKMTFHHGANHHIWTYCLHLGPFTYQGKHYDLGILLRPECSSEHLSLAVVYGPEDYQYNSGSTYMEVGPPSCASQAIRNEVIKRYEAQIEGGE